METVVKTKTQRITKGLRSSQRRCAHILPDARANVCDSYFSAVRESSVRNDENFH